MEASTLAWEKVWASGTTAATALAIAAATATVGAVGDILMHDAIIQGGYVKETDSYDFNYIFK